MCRENAGVGGNDLTFHGQARLQRKIFAQDGHMDDMLGVYIYICSAWGGRGAKKLEKKYENATPPPTMR